MSQTCVRLFYGETSQAIAVGLPYGDKEQMVAFFIMPKQKYGLQALEAKIADEDHLTEILDNSVDYSKVVTVAIPKFKLDLTPYNIRPTLMIMGTTTMFAQGFVDFSKINSQKNLYVTHAAHKAFFEAKEGTSRLCPNDETSDLDKVFVTFNQPFVLAVVEKSTRNLLLYGHVMSVD
uniref:Serpin domain-containing protein n=1 Tax=Romanomermis culicivorax TaxID=13658 RepID=A0A915K1X2_ROMCU